MGISSNQARFLALTSRQVDLEFRIQQICQRRLRLASELENTATSYNNSISNRQMFTMNTSSGGIGPLTLSNIRALNDTNGNAYEVVGNDSGTYYGVLFGAGNLNINATTITPASLGLAAGASEQEMVDAALRAGLITVATVADEFTQTPVYLGTDPYELKDWRTLPAIADELLKSDDVDAENKYDKTISEINAQDKKLQLEQTSIEVEYKAVSSERESVKKILDTNAQASFKYFS